MDNVRYINASKIGDGNYYGVKTNNDGSYHVFTRGYSHPKNVESDTSFKSTMQKRGTSRGMRVLNGTQIKQLMNSSPIYSTHLSHSSDKVPRSIQASPLSEESAREAQMKMAEINDHTQVEYGSDENNWHKDVHSLGLDKKCWEDGSYTCHDKDGSVRGTWNKGWGYLAVPRGYEHAGDGETEGQETGGGDVGGMGESVKMTLRDFLGEARTKKDKKKDRKVSKASDKKTISKKRTKVDMHPVKTGLERLSVIGSNGFNRK